MLAGYYQDEVIGCNYRFLHGVDVDPKVMQKVCLLHLHPCWEYGFLSWVDTSSRPSFPISVIRKNAMVICNMFHDYGI